MKNMSLRSLKLASVGCLLALAVGCESAPTVGGAVPGDGPTDGGGAPEDDVQGEAADPNKKLWMQLESAWESEPTTYALQGSCEIPDDRGVELAPLDCTIEIPEGRLYYSGMKFTIGTNNVDTCSIVSFSPYYYMASTSATFQPPWTSSEIDCSDDPGRDCFSGAATEIALDFPKTAGRYFIPRTYLKYDYTTSSANSKKRGSNRWLVNDIAAADINTALSAQNIFTGPPNPYWDPKIGYGDAYVSGSIQDYIVTCANQYYEPLYSIRLLLKDKDTPAGADPTDGEDNQITTWDAMRP